MIDRLTVERIKEASNIVEVVSEFVTLKKSGANYKGLCPFHNEKTPSFMVSPARGTCHCFGCGKGGNPVSFIMEHEQLTYPEALRWLARKYGIEIKEKEMTDRERQEQSARESMFIVNEWAATYFENLLRNDADGIAIGMQYYRSRGFRDDVIKRFRLGFDLRNRNALAMQAKSQGYKEEFLLKTGICYQNDRGELVDRYAERVIFPWIGLSGKVVGFSARVLDSRTKGVNQKYVNSPDSDIYHKERELYGIYQAKKSIARDDRVYIVEGQTDVLSMSQCGIENVVANSGTALSVHQIHMLRRFTSNITLLYDGDAAGMHAAMRGTDMLLAEGMNVKVLFLPDGDDPDSFARKHSATEFRDYVEQYQTDFIEFKINHLLRQAKDPQQRSEAIESIVRSISVVQNQILRDTYLHECATRVGMNESTLIERMNSIISERKRTGNAAAKPVATAQNEPVMSSTSKIERMIAQLVVRHGGYVIYENVEDENGNLVDVSVAQYISLNLEADNLVLHTPVYATILREAAERSIEKGFDSETYFINHEDINVSTEAAQLAIDRYALTQSKPASEVGVIRDEKAEKEKQTDFLRSQAEHLTLDLRMDYVDNKLRDLKVRIAQMGDSAENLHQAMVEYTETLKMRNELARQIGVNIK